MLSLRLFAGQPLMRQRNFRASRFRGTVTSGNRKVLKNVSQYEDGAVLKREHIWAQEHTNLLFFNGSIWAQGLHFLYRFGPMTMVKNMLITAALLVTAVSVGLVYPPTPAQAQTYALSDASRVVSQPANQTKESKGKSPRSSDDPLDVFADFEDAWLSENVGLILNHFGKGKVTISISGTGPSGGDFSKSQSYYLLKDLFKYTTTSKFEFVQFRKLDDDGRSSFAVAEREYKKADDGRVINDKIYVSLHREESGKRERWVIDEIKSIR